MTKKELIKSVAEATENTQTSTEATLNAALETITTALAKGDSVDLFGFGKFVPALQKGKSGTVPGTSKTYTTQDKMVPKFKAAKALKDSVAAGK